MSESAHTSTGPAQRPFALVTGASSGIGAALAREIAGDGYDLVLVARREEALRELARSLPVRAEIVPLDLGDPGAGDALEAKLAEFGVAVDLLVNNAGYGMMGGFGALDRAEQLGMIDLNVRALVDLTHRFLGPMRARGRGGVINLASTAAFQPGPRMAVYFAAKSFVLSFSEALAFELKGEPVTVTAICPGPTTTEFQARARMERTRLFKVARPMTAEDVARIGWRGYKRGRPVIIPGLHNAVGAAGAPFVPRPLVLRIANALQDES